MGTKPKTGLHLDAIRYAAGGATVALALSALVVIGLEVSKPAQAAEPTANDRVAEFERLCGPALELAPTIATECESCGDRLCCWKPPKIGAEERYGGAMFSCNAKGCFGGWPGETVR